MDIRAAKDIGEVNEAYELAAKIFGPNYFEARDAKAHHRSLEATERLEDVVVVVDSSRVLGFVRVLDRQLFSPAGLIKAGGITSVCVHPELRGQGWGLRVMEGALQRSRERGDSLSVLFARRAVDSWYPKLGYVGIGCHMELRSDTSALRSTLGVSSCDVQPGMVKSWTNIYGAAYADSYEGLFLSFYRDGEWWRSFESRLGGRIDGDDFLTVLEEAKPIGYLVRKDGVVIEAAALDQHRTKFADCLLQILASDHPDPMAFRLPMGHWVVPFLRRFNHTINIRYSWDGGHMVRILDKSVFKDMAMCLGGRDSVETIEKTFAQYDMVQHDDAHQLLSTLVGAHSVEKEPNTDLASALRRSTLFSALPTWSVIDGF